MKCFDLLQQAIGAPGDVFNKARLFNEDVKLDGEVSVNKVIKVLVTFTDTLLVAFQLRVPYCMRFRVPYFYRVRVGPRDCHAYAFSFIRELYWCDKTCSYRG